MSSSLAAGGPSFHLLHSTDAAVEVHLAVASGRSAEPRCRPGVVPGFSGATGDDGSRLGFPPCFLLTFPFRAKSEPLVSLRSTPLAGSAERPDLHQALAGGSRPPGECSALTGATRRSRGCCPGLTLNRWKPSASVVGGLFPPPFLRGRDLEDLGLVSALCLPKKAVAVGRGPDVCPDSSQVLRFSSRSVLVLTGCPAREFPQQAAGASRRFPARRSRANPRLSPSESAAIQGCEAPGVPSLRRNHPHPHLHAGTFWRLGESPV